MRIVNNTILRTPNLLKCDPNSFANGLLLLSQYGLEPDGRRAHLIPFRNNKADRTELQVIIDWKGLAELILRSGTIAKLHADLICENDDFEFDMGDVLHHRIDFRKDRGQPYAAWAMAQTKTGEKFVQVMQQHEIEAVRNSSSGWRAFKGGKAFSSPWQDHPGEMWKKTVFRRLSKWLPLSPELRDAVEHGDDDDEPSRTAVVSSVQSIQPLVELPDAPAEDEDDLPMGDEPPKAVETPPAEAKDTPQAELMTFVTGSGFTFDHFKIWAEGVGAVANVDSMSGFRDMPTDVAKRLLRSKAGLIQGLEMAKAQGGEA